MYRPGTDQESLRVTVEYALIVVGIAAVVAAIVFVLGQTVFDSSTNSCQKVTNRSGTC